MLNIKTVTVIGANGTMGANISGIFASFGGAKVYMVSRELEKSEKAILKACKSVRADSIKANLIPADYSMLEDCVKESDLIFESIAENLELKMEITKKIASAIKKNAISCTGTSGLSITKLSECFSEDMRKKYFGVHMFNPPYNMPLCELIGTKYSDDDLKEELSEYLSTVLLRTVVNVKDKPAFLANRIGFQFINEALIYAEKYKDNGGVDYIDAILGAFTGRAMSPIATADFVGLDIHKAIVDNVYNNVNDYVKDTFVLPDYILKLIAENKLGRKTAGGLYKAEVFENGIKRIKVYDINTDSYREKINYLFPFAEKMKKYLADGEYVSAFKELINNHSKEAEICVEFLLKYIVYSLNTAKEVGFEINAADDVMATGFNWCPPLAMIQAFSTVSDIKKLVIERIDNKILLDVDIDLLFNNVTPSKYDYRIYFKAK